MEIKSNRLEKLRKTIAGAIRKIDREKYEAGNQDIEDALEQIINMQENPDDIRKNCPLSLGSEGMIQRCMKDNCPLWDSENKECTMGTTERQIETLNAIQGSMDEMMQVFDETMREE